MEYLRNKKAALDYHFIDTYECGIELLGTEVKSVKHHHGSLNSAYVQLLNGTLVLIGAHIPAWQEKNASPAYDPYRSRTLLVHKKELYEFEKIRTTKGLTIVPIRLYNSRNSRIKLEIAVARGKKEFDKRETIKKRDLDREARRGIDR